MAGNGFQATFGNDRPPSSTGSGENELTADPASSGFFMNDFKKHEDLKVMLDGNKDHIKLEAMKRIIGILCYMLRFIHCLSRAQGDWMVAKGKDASDLFPAVVKNVVSKNIEIKKLVYVYLTRYAEEQQDLALLSISTFQRALKDPNQLIRASALRVLSSIRVIVIVPIMMLAIKEAVMDMSPYVRKTAAHAIPKLYSLDPEQKDQLMEVIEKLLADKTTLVIGSAIQAFEEVCPERIDLIHKNYRKLCNLLVDVEEWGQVVIVNMLTRYCRTQFINPNIEGAVEGPEKEFYHESEDDDDEENEKPVVIYVMDADHRLLLRQTKPLLNSMNAAVVTSVAQLYHHCAPKSEVGSVAKALVRLLRSHKEIQYVVLSNVATMSLQWKGMFEPYLKSFYIRSSDPTHVKLLKLEILTNLASETNISTILREFQTYVTSTDKEFAAATIQALGRCASNISEVTDTCLNGLVHLMSNRDESVVAESVVVIKKLLQIQPKHADAPSEHKDIIIHMAKIMDKITVPMARASILWLIGEYCDRVPRIAPDVLRKMAKCFTSEEDIVKLQIVNLAAKLFITNSKQTVCKLLCQYVFSLAKYDQNYDIRDRARFLRALIMPTEKSELTKKVKKIFLSTKPAPLVESKFKDREQYQLGSLSHVMNLRTQGYQELPEWPTTAPDPSVRDVEIPVWEAPTVVAKEVKEHRKSFYSSSSSESEEDSEKSSDEEEESGSEGEKGKNSDEGRDSAASLKEESEEESEDSSEDSSEEEKVVKKTVVRKSEESEEESSSEEGKSSSESDSEEDTPKVDTLRVSPKPVPTTVPVAKKTVTPTPAPTSAPVAPSTKKSSKKQPAKDVSSDLLLDLGDDNNTQSASSTAVLGAMLTPMQAVSDDLSRVSLLDQPTPSSQVMMSSAIEPKTHELLNRITGGGLSATYKFPRTISIFSPKMVSVQVFFTNSSDKPVKNIAIVHKMVSVQVFFTNSSDKPVKNIAIVHKTLPPGLSLQEFPEIETLGIGSTTEVLMSIDFNDTTQPAKFVLRANDKSHILSISGPVGELLQSHTMNEKDFNAQQGKLGGMNENSGTAKLTDSSATPNQLCTRVFEAANVLQVPSSEENVFKFCGNTLSAGTLVLVTVKVTENLAKILVNCEKMVIGAMLVKDIKASIERVV